MVETLSPIIFINFFFKTQVTPGAPVQNLTGCNILRLCENAKTTP